MHASPDVNQLRVHVHEAKILVVIGERLAQPIDCALLVEAGVSQSNKKRRTTPRAKISFQLHGDCLRFLRFAGLDIGIGKRSARVLRSAVEQLIAS